MTAVVDARQRNNAATWCRKGPLAQQSPRATLLFVCQCSQRGPSADGPATCLTQHSPFHRETSPLMAHWNLDLVPGRGRRVSQMSAEPGESLAVCHLELAYFPLAGEAGLTHGPQLCRRRGEQSCG